MSAVAPVLEVVWLVLPVSVEVAATGGSAVPKGVTLEVADVASDSVVVHGCQFGLPELVAVTTAVYVAVASVAVQIFVPSQYV